MPGRGKHRESGNIFFMLFGAVALVGVIGAATMTLVRGPLSTVSAVNQRAKADSQLAIATKLATIAAVDPSRANSGNCDAGAGDTFIEPVPATVAMPAPVGGGQLPTSFGAAQVDPWGTPYGYCVWDLGQAVGDAACDDGDVTTAPYLTGGNSGAQPVFVVMSAGPNRTFETQCNAWADAVPSNASTLIDKPGSSDDVLAALSYEEAQNAADGLWSIKTGDPGTITTDKNVEFASGSTATFQGTAQFAPNSRLDLGGPTGAGLFLLPDQTELLDAECTGVNSGALRINTASGFNVLEMCDPAVPGFVALGGAGATVSAIDDLSDAASGTADKFLFLGEGAGLNFNSSSGSNNIGIGINAASTLVGGSGNIVIGNDADTNLATTANSIVIGNGVISDGSNTMKIGEFLYGASVYSSGSGMLGIGAAPTVTLDVAGTAEATRFQLDSNTYMDDSSGNLVLGAGGSTRVTIESAGNVGIGVADPNVALDVSGDAQISGDAFADQFISTALGNAGTPNFTFNTATNAGLYYQSSGMGFSIGGLNEMTLTSGGLTVDGFGDFGGYVEGDNFQFTGATNSGLFYASGTGVSVNVGGVAAIFAETSGDVGIGDSTPDVKLDVAGAIRPGDTAVLCGASIYGAIRYASGDVLEMCSSMTNDWETIGTSGGGGGGSGSLWTNNTSYITRGTFSVINTGASLPAGLTGAGARAFWYPDKWSFRAGGVSGTQWDDADIGNYSAAFGLDNTASGAYAFSAGRLNTASNAQSIALGYGVTSSGDSSLATGSLTSATGNYSTAMGLKATASGLRSFAFGLGDPASNPVVSGAGSFGIFMGDQSGVNISTANLMALMGGKLIIDPDATSAANTVPSGSLTVDVEGGVGAMQYCDEDGLNCFTAYDISSGSVGVPGNDREMIFNSGGSLWTDINLVFTSAGRLGIGTSNPQVTLDLAATDALIIPHGTTAQRPATGAAGMVRYNSSTSIDSVEYYDAQTSTWQRLATATDATTAAGADTQVQFNSGGSFGADADYTWDMTNNILSIANSGTGAMRVGNGAVGAPSLSFTADPNTGLYNVAADTIGFAANGAEVARMTTGQIGLVAGAVGAPAYSFTGDLNTGLYNVGADALGVAANGVNYMTVQDPGAANASVIFGGSAAVTLPSGATATRPSAGVNGMIRYNTDNGKFEAYQAGAWQDILTGSAAAASPDRGIQFNSGGNFAASANFQYTSAGALLVTGSYTGAGTEPVSGAGTRMFFDPGKAAFRAGGVTGNQWNFSSAGNYSAAFGYNTTASGAMSVAAGVDTIASGASSTAMGQLTTASGSRSTALGWGTTASGIASTALGEFTIASGDYSIAMGDGPAASGFASTAMGSNTIASGVYSTAIGRMVTAGDDTAGSGMGDGSMAIGLIDNAVTITTPSQVTGIQSMGIFMGDQDGLVMSANNTMGLFGGKMVIDPAVPATQLSARATLDMGASTDAILLPIGDGTNRPAAPFNGMLRYNSSSGKFEGYQGGLWQDILTSGGGAITAAGANTQIQFNSGGTLGADADYTWDMMNNILAIANSGTGAMRVGNGAVGAPSLSFTADPNTGLYNVGADAIGVAANGVNYMTVQDPGAANASVIFGGGAAVTLPSGATAARPSAGVNGMIRYNTDNGKFEAYQGGSWQDILTGSASAATPDRGIQFNSGGAFTASSNFQYMADGDLLLSGTYTGTASVPATGAGTRMFFDTQTAAFRAGRVNGTQWDDANIGNSSVAMGVNTTASGSASVALGGSTTASGNSSLAIGNFATASGDYCVAMGSGATASGSSCMAMGMNVTASGSGSTGMGLGTTASGNFSTAMGMATAASGIASTAMGSLVVAGNGTAGSGLGDGSMALGLIDDAVVIATPSQVTGIQSLGIFMGDQDGLVMSAANTMGLFGGKMVIDPAVPATQLTARGVIDAGAATDAIVFPSGTTGQRPGAPVNGMLRYNSTSGKFEGYQAGLWTDIITAGASASAPDRGIQFNSGGAFTASSDLRYMADGDLLLTGTWTGTASVPVAGAGTRMFFDTQKAAFRAGVVSGAQWDNASIGDGSVAMGTGTTASGSSATAMGMGANASGSSATAMGNGVTASGSYSTAMGNAAVASGSYGTAMGSLTAASGNSSTAMGNSTTASGVYSTAMGYKVVAGNGTAGSGFGDGSMAIGLIDDAVTITTPSQVTGIQSYGIFMGDQDGLVMSAANTMGLFGGKMVIDPAVPATQLTARGVIDAGAATDAIVFPSGTTAQRPGAPVNGMIRYNSSTSKFEGYQGGLWTDIITAGASAAAPDRGIQFNSGGSFAASGNFTYDATGRLYLQYNSTFGGFPARLAGTDYARQLYIENMDGTGGSSYAGMGLRTASFDSGVFSVYSGVADQGRLALVTENVEAMSIVYGAGGAKVGIGTATPSYLLSLDGDTANQAIGMERETTAATAGWNLSINAGGAVSGGADLAGGNLVLKSGIATGNGLSSIQFQTVMPGQGAGAADRAPATSMTLASNALSLPAGTTAQRPGSAGMQAAVNGMIRYNSSNGKFEAYQAGAWTNMIGGGAIDDLSDGKTDYAVNFNLFMGTAADAWAPAASSQYNLAIGQNALDAALTNAADYNMAIGYNALTANTSGSRNIAIGPFALDTVTTGAGNVAIGPTAMQDTPAGTMRNVAIGDSAGYKSDGDDNVFIGSAVRSASGGTIGSQNVAIGSDAMRYANGSGNVILGYDAGGTGNAGMSVDDMVAIGRLSLGSATDGDKNVGVGIYTLSDTTTGYNNVAIGSYALEKNVAKQESTAIGYGAMEYADSAAAGSVTYNTAIGAYALQGSATPASNTGTSNTAIGHSALLGVTSGSGNIAIGDRAADILTTGSNNITIGSNIDAVSATGSSQLNIGDTIYGDMANDRLRIGGAGAVSAFSDLELAGTLALKVSAGTTAQRPGTGANGMLRYNTTSGKFEGYQGGSWQDIVTGAAVSTFLSLTDTPANYAGAGGKFVKVNSGATALEFTDTLVNSFSGQPAPTGMVFDDLDDVVITAVASGQFPVYNGANWVNAANLSWNGTTLAVTGNITFTGTLHDVSDMRLKKDIVPLHDRGSMMDKLEQIGTYSFRMKDDKEGQIEFGVMAQEINKVFPELVAVDEASAEKYMSVNYLGLIAPLLEASKELKAENDDLKTRLASVEDDIKGMKAYTGYGINKASIGPGMMMGMIIGMIAATGFSALFFAVFTLRRQRRQMADQPTSIE